MTEIKMMYDEGWRIAGPPQWYLMRFVTNDDLALFTPSLTCKILRVALAHGTFASDGGAAKTHGRR